MWTAEFGIWCRIGRESESDEAILFCYGNPGVGEAFIK